MLKRWSGCYNHPQDSLVTLGGSKLIYTWHSTYHPECWEQSSLCPLLFAPSITWKTCMGIKQKHTLKPRLPKCYSRFRQLSYISIPYSGQTKTQNSVNFRSISIAPKSLPYTSWKPDYSKHTWRIVFRNARILTLIFLLLYLTLLLASMDALGASSFVISQWLINFDQLPPICITDSTES